MVNWIEVYNKQVSLSGNLLLASKGLGGNGDATFDASNLEAKNFWFKQDAYGSDTADFKLKSDIESVLAIQTKNVNAIQNDGFKGYKDKEKKGSYGLLG